MPTPPARAPAPQVPGCLTQGEADKLVAAAEAVGFQHQGSRGAAFGEAFRDNDRISFNDQQLADHIWQACGLRQLMEGQLEDEQGVAVGLNPNIRCACASWAGWAMQRGLRVAWRPAAWPAVCPAGRAAAQRNSCMPPRACLLLPPSALL